MEMWYLVVDDAPGEDLNKQFDDGSNVGLFATFGNSLGRPIPPRHCWVRPPR
jgi:hypothetical protein